MKSTSVGWSPYTSVLAKTEQLRLRKPTNGSVDKLQSSIATLEPSFVGLVK